MKCLNCSEECGEELCSKCLETLSLIDHEDTTDVFIRRVMIPLDFDRHEPLND